MRQSRWRLTAGLMVLFALICLPHSVWAQKGGKGGGGGDGGTVSGPTFAMEILNFSGEIIDFNDQTDVLGRIDVGDGDTYYLGTLDAGVRTFEEIRVPAGWTIFLKAMNNSRHVVGTARFDRDGDGVDANGDGQLDEGDINQTGILLTPDANNDGLWEMNRVFLGPMSASCVEINNDGDIVGSDQSLGNVLLWADDSVEALPFLMISVSTRGSLLSRRNVNGNLFALNTLGPNYLSQRYSTATGQAVSLPTFSRATYINAYAYSVNSSGVAVGRADEIPAYWSPEGSISRIPGWSTSKSATGYAFDINESGDIVITSGSQGPHLYRPSLGLVPLRRAIVNPEVIPTGYQLGLVGHINHHSAICGSVENASFVRIPCVLHPIPAASP